MRYRNIKRDLPRLKEDERIYLNVPYITNGFARASHCGFDAKRKLWFTGPRNNNICSLIDLYGINTATSDDALLTLASLHPAVSNDVQEIINKKKETIT